MSNRYDLPRIRATERPTRFNREAAFYGLGLGIIATAGALFFSPVPLTLFTVAASSAVFGAIVGSSKGLARQNQEAATGRVVKDPTFLNLGISNGIFTVAALGLLAAGGLWVAGAGVLGLTTLSAAAVAGNTTAALMAGHLFTGTLATNIAGALVAGGGIAAVVGSLSRRRTMQKEFDRSVSVSDHHGCAAPAYVPVQSMGVAPTLYKDSVSAQEAALLEAKQGASSSQADKLSAVRALLADQAQRQ